MSQTLKENKRHLLWFFKQNMKPTGSCSKQKKNGYITKERLLKNKHCTKVSNVDIPESK